MAFLPIALLITLAITGELQWIAIIGESILTGVIVGPAYAWRRRTHRTASE